MPIWTRKLVLSAVLCPMFLAAGPQGAGAEGLSLSDAVSLAVENNPQVRAAAQAVRAADGRHMQARALAGPEVSVEIGGIRGSNLEGAQDRKFGISQPFEFPGKRALRAAIAQDGLSRARMGLERARRLAAAQAWRGFVRVLADEEIRRTLDGLLETLKQLQDTVIARYRAGGVPYTEIARTRMEVFRIQNEIAETEQGLAAARRSLNLTLGRKPDEPMVLAGSFADLTPPVPVPRSVQEVVSGNESLRMQEAELAAAEKERDLARKTLLPDFRIGAFYDRSDGLEPLRGWALEAGMNVPLYWNWKQRGLIRESEGRAGEAAERHKAFERAAAAAAADSLARVDAGRAHFESYRTRVLPEAEEALHAGLTHYQYGRIDTLNLMDLYRSYRATRIEAIRAARDQQDALAALSAAGEAIE